MYIHLPKKTSLKYNHTCTFVKYTRVYMDMSIHVWQLLLSQGRKPEFHHTHHPGQNPDIRKSPSMCTQSTCLDRGSLHGAPQCCKSSLRNGNFPSGYSHNVHANLKMVPCHMLIIRLYSPCHVVSAKPIILVLHVDFKKWLFRRVEFEG